MSIVFLSHLNLLSVEQEAAEHGISHNLLTAKAFWIDNIETVTASDEDMSVAGKADRALVVRARLESVSVVIVADIVLPLSIRHGELYVRYAIFCYNPNVMA